MNAKKVTTTALLAFVGASVLYLAIGERAPAGGPDRAGGDAVSAEPARAGTVAYYFHGTARCRTCLAIENGAREILQRELADDFESGAIRWQAVDFEQPGNEHFAREFELTESTLVLVKEVGGRVERWDKLERVWELIGDDVEFHEYVLSHARDYLRAS